MSESHTEYVDNRQHCISILINFVLKGGGTWRLLNFIRIVVDHAGLWDCYSTRRANRNQKVLVLLCGDPPRKWLADSSGIIG